jgi:crotonobetainyl-CoA:carnitine CoA-transferase CaiB-like acyl-CoA transferase
MLHEIELADGRKERTVGVGIKLLGTPGEIRSPAPVTGEHTKEILLDLGYTETMIKELARQGSIVLDKA